MRENSGRSGRVSSKVKAALVAMLAVFAVAAVGTGTANAADGKLKMTFDQGRIAVLPEILGPVEADPPAGQPVTIEGALAENGTFTAPKEGFNFPTQTIPLPNEPLINGLIGNSLDIMLAATDTINGNFNRDSGAFTGTIPLALTLKFSPPPPTVITCIVPFTLSVDTSKTLTFPGAGEGGTDIAFPSKPFAPPSRDGAIYGEWPAVPFTAIQDGPGMEGGDVTCAGLLGLLPNFIDDWPEGLNGIQGQIWLAGKAEVTEAPATCPAGQTGTPPNCATPVGKVGKLTITKKVTVKRGKVAKVKVTVTNVGTGALKGKIALKSSNKQVKAPKSVAVNIAAGKSMTKVVKVKTTKKAKGKANITASIGGKKAKAVVTIKR